MSVEPSAFLLKEQELMKLNEEINLKTQTALNRTKAAAPPPKVKPKDVVKQQPQTQKPQLETNLQKSIRLTTLAVTEEQPVREQTNDLPNNTNAISAKRGPNKPVTQVACSPISKNLEKRNLSSEGLIKFLKSKVTILQDEIDIHQKENLKKNEELQQLQQNFNKLEQQRDQLNAKNNSLQAEVQRAQEKIIELELKVKERDNDALRLGKEGDVSRRDLKMLQSTNGALEKRLLHAQNEIEALKVSLASAYDRERESRDQGRSEKDCAEKQIKQLRRQRVSLITAYKQQLLLMDNLRRQNLCLEEAKMLEFSEKEFTKILNWEK